jgi:general stress protein 26
MSRPTQTRSFADIRDRFNTYLAQVGYANMTTVDRKGRPRNRVLIAVWEETDDGLPVGWLATYRTPVKAAHLAANPHASFSYWSPRQNAAFVDVTASWVTDPEARRHVWRLYRTGSPAGVGYDPGAFWSGPDDPQYHLLRLDPWRIQLVRGTDLHSTIWRPAQSPGGE